MTIPPRPPQRPPPTLWIRNGAVVSRAGIHHVDLVAARGRFEAIGAVRPAFEAYGEIDASDLWLLPGGVDVHTHPRMNVGPHHTADDLVSATRAALAGGITTVIDLGDEPPPPPSDGLEIGWMTLAELTWVWAEGPAQRFGLAPRKGAIEPGADADLVAVDPAALVTRQDGDRGLRVSIADPRRCSEIRSAVRWVLRGGEVVVDDGQLLGDLTGGRFLALRPKQE